MKSVLVEDEVDDEADSMEEDIVVDRKCGVQGCPSKETVWRSALRLEEHRSVISYPQHVFAKECNTLYLYSPYSFLVVD